ncbi:MAG TPA: putative glycolipid-binding domain-containing protein [Solirubrobacteraceae bacterium]|jgi:hypothetical protein
MSFRDPPRSAAWRHRDARDGFEVVFVHPQHDGYRFEGGTAAVEDGAAWVVDYALILSAGWLSRRAEVSGRSASGTQKLRLEADGAGRWRTNGAVAPHLDGCLDVDLESSALTNAIPVQRLGLEIGQEADAPAAYVRALDLSVERLDQRYVRLDDDDGRQRYHYAAPGFGFECQLLYDEFGLVLDYPGIALRAG